jgi:hypothetical protein
MAEVDSEITEWVKFAMSQPPARLDDMETVTKGGPGSGAQPGHPFEGNHGGAGRAAGDLFGRASALEHNDEKSFGERGDEHTALADMHRNAAIAHGRAFDQARAAGNKEGADKNLAAALAHDQAIVAHNYAADANHYAESSQVDGGLPSAETEAHSTTAAAANATANAWAATLATGK